MRTFTLLYVSACLLPLALPAQQPPSSAQDPAHHDAVSSRGDHAMGFSHETTTHHFRLYKTGGAIDVSANNPKDSTTRDEIRMHLSQIAKRFAAGDFDVPLFIHDTTPPGAPVMAKLPDQLRFQISDHQTGDATEVR